MFSTKQTSAPIDCFTQSFVLQYISLMLFILIFSIAAFIPKEETGVETSDIPLVTIEPQIEKKVDKIIASIPIQDLFEPARSELNESGWDAYKAVLTSHDINIALTISWGSRIGLDTAMQRAEASFDFLRSIHVPEDAIKITVTRAEGEGIVHLSRGAP